MQKFSMSRFLLALCLSATLAAALDSVKSLDVPEPVMDFILGCERTLRGGPKLPVATVEFDPISGESYEQVNLLDFTKLRNSLGESITNQDLVDSIFKHIQQSLSSSNQRSGRTNCMNVKVENPTFEPRAAKNDEQIKHMLNEVVGNNNYVILESLNRLFEHQLRRLFTKVEALVRDSQGSPDKPSLLRAEDFKLDLSEFISTGVKIPPKPIHIEPIVSQPEETVKLIDKTQVQVPAIRRTAPRPNIPEVPAEAPEQEQPEEAGEKRPLQNRRRRLQGNRRNTFRRIPFRGQRNQQE